MEGNSLFDQTSRVQKVQYTLPGFAVRPAVPVSSTAPAPVTAPYAQPFKPTLEVPLGTVRNAPYGVAGPSTAASLMCSRPGSMSNSYGMAAMEHVGQKPGYASHMLGYGSYSSPSGGPQASVHQAVMPSGMETSTEEILKQQRALFDELDDVELEVL